ncbi:multidrug resistance-associated protein 1-like isoform X1 [Tubulanus polymorphus]|uniref:multidrug resistance-associated protein 1-like isoform X1 n=1 Tax=Tubulanus polymorphus TaxID=672921 RepID=UPI003DA6B8E8
MYPLCGGLSPVWDSQISWNTTDPDFTRCFQKTILFWIPCAYLCLAAPIYLFYLWRRKNSASVPHSWLSLTKTILFCFLAAVCLAEIFRWVHHESKDLPVDAADFLQSSCLLVAFGFCLLCVQYGRIKGVRSSGVLFIFWLLLVICDIVVLRSKIRHAVLEGKVSDIFAFVTFMLHFVAVLVQLVLSCIMDKHADGFLHDDKDQCPEENAPFLSRISFWWFTGMVIQGYKRALVTDDLWKLNHNDQCSQVSPILEKQWLLELQKARNKSAEKEKKNDVNDKDGIHLKPMLGTEEHEVAFKGKQKSYEPSLYRSLIRSFGVYFAASSCLKLIHDILVFLNPLILRYLIDFTVDKSQPRWRGFLYAGLLFIVALFQSFILQLYFHRCMVTGMRVRSSLVAAVYKKSLRLSSASKRKSTTGEVVNLMSVDAQRFLELTMYLNMIWSAPFQITVSMYFLWYTLGPAVLAGLGVMILMLPINAVLAHFTRKFQIAQMKEKDERIKLMNEVLNGIKVLKLYAWEESFMCRILGIRNKELSILKKNAYLNAAISFAWNCTPFIVCLVSFAVFILSSASNQLDAQTAFVSLALFNIMRFPLFALPMVISAIVQANVSLQRLSEFLQRDDLENSVVYSKETDVAVKINDGKFAWDKTESLTLDGINLDIKPGSLVAVVGSVGAGKSSLVSAILGEMEKVSGTVTINGSIGYVSQQAWIQNATLRENVLFNESLEEDTYWKVINACQLKPDLEQLTSSDETEIGEKGINLSGGQKQRVALARAVYSNCDIYLLDDPLSAVDAHVGKHIFENVIGPCGMLSDKTRVLVTHGINYLKHVDHIVVLQGGRVSETGSYAQLLDHAGPFAEFLRNYLEEDEEVESELDDDVKSLREDIIHHITPMFGPIHCGSAAKLNSQTYLSHDSLRKSHDSLHHLKSHESLPPKSPALKRYTSHTSDAENSTADAKKREGGGEKDQLIQTESAETGTVKLSVFLTYIKAIGIPMSILIVIVFALVYVSTVSQNIWLSDWSDEVTLNEGNMTTARRDMRLGVYASFGFIQGLFVMIGSLALSLAALKAAGRLHVRLLQRILRAPMVFFDTTPLGRIVNRFSKDIDTIDVTLREKLDAWLRCACSVAGTIIVISISTPLFLSMIVPLSILFFFVQRFYVCTSRQLKRLESISRSPIFSHFGETLSGSSTIRAFKQEDRFIRESQQRVDDNHICYYPNVVSNRWLAIRLEFVGNCIIFFSALFAVVARDTVSPGTVGLSITYAMNVTQTLNWMVRMTSELETNIVSVERVKEYSEIPIEAEWVNEDNRPPKDWPHSGKVDLDQFSLRYREGLDLVIKGITCHIQPGEKVGLVGRTGAGKSSLTLGLFRILEAAEGSLIIDGIDISKIGLHDLRSKITIIPQDPVLFSGTLRSNLDPFDKYTDDELWTALEYCHLRAFIKSLAEGLQHDVAEGGENLSVGQRQLICLGRALLRKTKILLLDEATAAVDLETDDLIQSTIRTQFADSTIITIAHRLNTVMDYTRIMVLDGGKVKEFDSPQILLQDKNTSFYSMAKDAGLAD